MAPFLYLDFLQDVVETRRCCLIFHHLLKILHFFNLSQTLFLGGLFKQALEESERRLFPRFSGYLIAIGFVQNILIIFYLKGFFLFEVGVYFDFGHCEKLMEMLLFESKTVYPFEMGLKGRTYFCPFSCRKHKVDLKFPQCCSCRGTAPKASYFSTSKTAQASHETTGPSMSKQKVSSEVFHYTINGANGASNLKLFPGQMRVLNGFDDEYGGVVVDPDRLPSDPDAFSSILRVSLSRWKMKGKKGIWLKLPVEQSRLVPIAIEEGFVYHHAEPRYVMLTYWIPNGPCMLPSNATHQVGIGGFVINDKNEVLVVQEKHRPPTCVDFWKIPTGFILESEEIFSGAVREVKEETGIDTEFVEVVAFRHAHNVAFDKSDLLFVCMLKPLSHEILVDDLEIQAAKWMPLHEFVAQPLLREDSLFDKIIEICIAHIRDRYCGLSALQLPSKFDGKQSSLYYNLNDSQDSFCSRN